MSNPFKELKSNLAVKRQISHMNDPFQSRKLKYSSASETIVPATQSFQPQKIAHAYSQHFRDPHYSLGGSFRVCFDNYGGLIIASGRRITLKKLHIGAGDAIEKKRNELVMTKLADAGIWVHTTFYDTVVNPATPTPRIINDTNTQPTTGNILNMTNTTIPRALTLEPTQRTNYMRVLMDSLDVSGDNDLFSDHEKRMWELVEIVLDRNESEDDLIYQHAHKIQKKNLLKQWLARTLNADQFSLANSSSEVVKRVETEGDGLGEKDGQNQNKTQTLMSILEALKANSIKKACCLAVKHKYIRLATLLSQAGGDSKFQGSLRKQIAIWHQRNLLTHMPNTLVTIYLVLAGQLLPHIELIDSNTKGLNTGPHSESKKNSSSTSEVSNYFEYWNSYYKGMSWLACLANVIWFSSFYDSDLKLALNRYEAASKLPNLDILPPIPNYVNPLTLDKANYHGCYDVLFQWIQFLADPNYDLLTLINPNTITNDGLDVRRSWHLAIMLRAYLTAQDKSIHQVDQQFQQLTNQDAEQKANQEAKLAQIEKAITQLTLDYTFHLNQLGQYHYAILIALHISDAQVRSQLIQSLLPRLVELQNESTYASYPSLHTLERGVHLLTPTEQMLSFKFHVPEVWIHEAKYHLALYEGQPHAAIQHAILSGHLNIAASLFFYEVLPRLVIFDQLEVIRDWLYALLEAGVVSRSSIPLQDYVNLVSFCTSVSHQTKALMDNLDSDMNSHISLTLDELLPVPSSTLSSMPLDSNTKSDLPFHDSNSLVDSSTIAVHRSTLSKFSELVSFPQRWLSFEPSPFLYLIELAKPSLNPKAIDRVNYMVLHVKAKLEMCANILESFNILEKNDMVDGIVG